MTTKTVQFESQYGQQVKQSGGFAAGDAVLFHFTVPAGTRNVLFLAAQVGSDANMRGMYAGKSKSGMLSLSFQMGALAPGDYSVVLTADGPVQDVNAHLTMQGHKTQRD